MMDNNEHLSAAELMEFRALKARYRELELLTKIVEAEEKLWVLKVRNRIGVDMNVCRVNVENGRVIQPPKPPPQVAEDEE